jgi:hypothetical protein
MGDPRWDPVIQVKHPRPHTLLFECTKVLWPLGSSGMNSWPTSTLTLNYLPAHFRATPLYGLEQATIARLGVPAEEDFGAPRPCFIRIPTCAPKPEPQPRLRGDRHPESMYLWDHCELGRNTLAKVRYERRTMPPGKMRKQVFSRTAAINPKA